jgi:hypothetical protein
MAPGRKWAKAFALLSLGAGILGSAPLVAAEPLTLAPAEIKAAESKMRYPKFSDIPQAPTGVRSLADWRTAIVETRLIGRRVAREAAAGPWILGDTESWAAQARALAVAPPPITTPYEGESELLAAALRARASAPPRSR